MSIRLIDVETLRLKSFNTRKTPPYAILSHTWVEDEEVSFEEMRQIAENPNHPATRKSGYRKIQETCRQARDDGFGYAWVDTCCIDKSSSAELSEAINSMFRWYRDAQVCFAYLSDYSSLDTKKDDMKECKWFTRGWCLQELIAPKNLIFYDQTWKAFGSKHGDKRLVASITGVNHFVLVDHNQMYSLPVAHRMSWASHRTTTRVEDTAYCLLGIFDIHMPLLYGEGEEAFVRLQGEIIRRLNDTSVFLFSPKSPNPNSSTSSESIHGSMHVSSTDGVSNIATFGSPRPEASNTYLNDLSEQQFCGMFATSPAEFHACGDIVHRSGHRAPFDREAFSVTNRGIQLGKQVLWYDFGKKHYFIWETAFRHSSHDDSPIQGAIIIREIGHNLFARVLFPEVRISKARRHVVHEDVCVLLHMTHLIEQQIHQSLKTVLRINVINHVGSHSQVLLSQQTPMDLWDQSGCLFLIPGAFFRRTFDYEDHSGLNFSRRSIQFTVLDGERDVITFFLQVMIMPSMDAGNEVITLLGEKPSAVLERLPEFGEDISEHDVDMVLSLGCFSPQSLRTFESPDFGGIIVNAKVCMEPFWEWDSRVYTCSVDIRRDSS